MQYGIVFLLTLTGVAFVIAAPSANWSRATALVVDGVALVATGAAPRSVVDAANVVIAFAVPIVILGVLLRLLRDRGVGDCSPATPTGHAVAVIEMLTGQLYLVTAIGLLIGNFAGRQKTT